MPYRALFVADIHAGNNLPWAVKNPQTLVTDRLLDIMDVLKQMSGYALEHSISDIWILGDLIDRRLVDAVTLKLVTEELYSHKEQGLNVRIVPGNHEAGDAACMHFNVEAFTSMGFWVASPLSASFIEPVDGFRVLAMPYMPTKRFEAVIDGQYADLILIHQTIKGGMVGGWVSPDGIDPALLVSVAPTTLSGHFHSPQTIGATVHYLGAPVQHTFADVGDQRGYWDITFNGKGKQPRRVKVAVNDSPTFLEFIQRVGGQGSDDFPDLSSIPAKSYVNLKLTGSEVEVNNLWINAQEWCAKAIANGARLAKPTPVHTQPAARSRIALGETSERPTWDKVLSSYLDNADCAGLNRQKLEQLAKELMTDADR
jgi:DNA repair exonuclease SbcCD nuclease subunit